MLVKINCVCHAWFEIKNGARHPENIVCPNCGRELPNNASHDLLNAMSSFEIFESKLDDSGNYEICVSK